MNFDFRRLFGMADARSSCALQAGLDCGDEIALAERCLGEVGRFDCRLRSSALRLQEPARHCCATSAESAHEIEAEIDRPPRLIREKNWAEADRIRDELLQQGIQLKDGKDPETGERVTTWEVKR